MTKKIKLKVGDILHGIKIQAVKELKIKTHKVKSIVEYLPNKLSGYIPESFQGIKYVAECTNGVSFPLDSEYFILDGCFDNELDSGWTVDNYLKDIVSIELKRGRNYFCHCIEYKYSGVSAIFTSKDENYFKVLQIVSNNIQEENKNALARLQKEMHKILKTQKATRELTEKELKLKT